MHLNGVHRHFDRLTPAERTALILAAQTRQDQGELRRLLDSAPQRLLRVPDHFLHCGDVLSAGRLARIIALDLSVRLYQAQMLLAGVAPHADTCPIEELVGASRRVYRAARGLVGFLDAWDRALVRHSLTAATVLGGWPGGAESVAFTRGLAADLIAHYEQSGCVADFPPDEDDRGQEELVEALAAQLAAAGEW